MNVTGSRRGALGGIAVLVAIIGALLIGYILFLPPTEREQILFGEYAAAGTGRQYLISGPSAQAGAGYSPAPPVPQPDVPPQNQEMAQEAPVYTDIVTVDAATITPPAAWQ
jgi:hypothetical protein